MDCQHCIFKIMDAGPPMSGGPYGGCQIGCVAGRLKDASPDMLKGKYYELDSFCNMHRQEAWKEKNSHALDLVKIARTEIASTFGIVLFDVAGADMSEFKRSIDHVVTSARQYEIDRVRIVVAFQQIRPVSQTLHLINEYSNQGVNIVGTTVFDPTWNISRELEKEMFQKVISQQYFIKLKVGDIVPENLFKEIDTIVNDELKKVVIFESGDVIATHRGLVRDAYLEFNDYDKMIEHLLNISRDGANYCQI